MKDNVRRDQRHLLTVTEVAELLHVHPNTVRKWSNRGSLKTYRLGERGDRRFDAEEVARLLREQGRKV